MKDNRLGYKRDGIRLATHCAESASVMTTTNASTSERAPQYVHRHFQSSITVAEPSQILVQWRMSILRVITAITSLCISLHAATVRAQKMTFGERQLAQVLEDRPTMKGIFDADHFIVSWVIDRFEHGAFGDRVYWDHHEPISKAKAEHIYQPRSMVRVTSDGDSSGLEKWTHLIYELFNIETARQMMVLDEQVLRNEIDRRRYAIENIRLEHLALVKSQQFLRQRLGAVKCSQADSFSRWLIEDDLEFNSYIEFLNSWSADEYNPLDYYERMFDRIQKRSSPYGPSASVTKPKRSTKAEKAATTTTVP